MRARANGRLSGGTIPAARTKNKGNLQWYSGFKEIFSPLSY